MHDYDKILKQANSMAQFILAGHSLVETSDEFGISKHAISYRLQLIGLTYTDLAKIRKERSKQTR
ncbi:MAG: hypothetical protein HFJ47_02245 [Clostridia bacterium]|nr:hypothetical protein [Clostridia bacterium]